MPAHPWSDLPSACCSQGSTRVERIEETQGQMRLPNLAGAMEAENCIRGKGDFLNSHMATMCAHDLWDVWVVRTSILRAKGEGQGTPNSQSFLFLLPSSRSFPSPVSQLVNCRLPGIPK